MNDKRMAPVQGYSVGIPWSLHLRAWDAYAAKYGRYQSAERIAERAGFSVGELDMFVPGWREEVSEITKLRAEVARLTAILDTVAELRIDKWLDCEARRLKVFNAELEDEVARLTRERDENEREWAEWQADSHLKDKTIAKLTGDLKTERAEVARLRALVQKKVTEDETECRESFHLYCEECESPRCWAAKARAVLAGEGVR